MDHDLQEIDIQPTDKVVFIHIPKTAGITLSSIIHPFIAGLPQCPEISARQLVQMPYEEIAQYGLFIGHFHYRLLEQIFPSGFLYMTFLRDPISRTISHYQYAKRQETFGASAQADAELKLVKEMTLQQFVSNDQLHLALDIVDIQTAYLGSSAPLQKKSTPESVAETLKYMSTQINSEVVVSVAGRRYPNIENLKVAKKRLEKGAAFFGIMERFQDSLFLLSFIFGWPPVIDSIRLNSTSKPEHTENIPDSNTLQIIQSKVSLDLELYRFGQDLFEQRFQAMISTLLERYGNHSQKALKPPLPTDVMVELLQKHYEERRNRRGQALFGSSRILRSSDLYNLLLYAEGAFGWHHLEISRYGPARWSGPGLESGFELPYPRDHQHIKVSFRILMVLDIEIIKKLSLTVNNVPVVLQHEKDLMETFIFTGNIPPEAVSGSFLRLIFCVPKTIAPCDVIPDNKDSRHLGILLNWVKLEAE